MTGMNISIPQEELNIILGKAILDSLTDDAKNTIIAEAIAHLNTPVGNSWDHKKQTPLQNAFNLAVQQLTNVLVHELVEEHFRADIKSKLAEMMQVMPEHAEFGEQGKVRVMTTIFDVLREGA